MLTTLVWKELRELLPVIVVVLLIDAFLICVGLGTQLGFLSSSARYYIRSPDTIPFVNDQLCFWILVVSGVAATIIGLWQTMWETSRGTFQFLLHRPVSRGMILGAKLLVGGVVSALLIFSPVLYYALWAASRGAHASPFFWPMTSAAWQNCAVIPLVYLGAFFSGLRPARWFGSRFLPLFAGFLSASLLVAASAEKNLQSLQVAWLILVFGAAFIGIVFVFGILRIAHTSDLS